MRTATARHFGAAKKAILALGDYYHSAPNDQHPILPYPSGPAELPFAYAPIAGAAKLNLHEDKLVFLGKSGEDYVFIKFVRRYSKEAHEKCSELGFAPRLRAFSQLPGGWYMVVMDYVADEYEDLYDALPRLGDEERQQIKDKLVPKVHSFHAAGFVHGDIRNTNVMVKKDRGEGMYLVDFDWAGEYPDAKYPMNINESTVRRPDGATSGEVITPEHDMFMVNRLV